MSDATIALATITAHRNIVLMYMQALSRAIEQRGVHHDLSKLFLDEFEGFVRINRAAREYPYGSEGYRASMDAEKGEEGCITRHYSRNPHHPEFHSSIEEMGFIDIIEMVVDWKAASATYGKMTLRESIPHHRERFEFTPGQWWLIESVVDWIESTTEGVR
jgi:hypothetical protein